MAKHIAVILLLFLAGCGSPPTPLAYSKEAPAGVYPAGLLSGGSFVMVGLRLKF